MWWASQRESRLAAARGDAPRGKRGLGRGGHIATGGDAAGFHGQCAVAGCKASGRARRRRDRLRTYGIGAQILKDLGLKRMRVLSAPKQLQGLVRLRSGSDRIRRWRRMSGRGFILRPSRREAVRTSCPLISRKVIEGSCWLAICVFAHRRAVQRFRRRAVAARRPRRAQAPWRDREADRDRARPGRIRHSHRRAQAGAVAALRGADRARRRHPRPDAAFRLCRGRMRLRTRAHRARIGCAHRASAC
jgi:hypothetical protein